MNNIKKLIQMLKEYQKSYIGHDYIFYDIKFCNPQVQMCIEALEKQLNGCWIPVSERLPKENEEVLITLAHGNATWAYLYQGKWHTMFSAYPIERVIAWQPLPEPYKEVENGVENKKST